MSLISRLIYARRSIFGFLVKEVLAVYGIEFPSTVEVKPGLTIQHRGFGTVIHGSTQIGRNVTIYQGVTVGRADAWIPGAQSKMERVVIGDDAVLCAGAKIICKSGVLHVGRGTIIGANAVLTRSTGQNEIWAGVPARKVGMRY